jgi:hypothetical protein
MSKEAPYTGWNNLEFMLKRMWMSKEAQSPIVKIGTKLSQGVVTGILHGKIEVLGESGVLTVPFTTIENEVLSNG